MMPLDQSVIDAIVRGADAQYGLIRGKPMPRKCAYCATIGERDEPCKSCGAPRR